MLEFDFGSYGGSVGQQRPAIILTHASGKKLSFLAFAFSNNVQTFLYNDAGIEFGNKTRTEAEANELYNAAIAKGYVVTETRVGGQKY